MRLRAVLCRLFLSAALAGPLAAASASAEPRRQPQPQPQPQQQSSSSPQLPTVERVRADIRGADAVDTAARRRAAFEVLIDASQRLIGRVDDTRGRAAIRAKITAYNEASINTQSDVRFDDPSCQGAACPQAQFFPKSETYLTSASFRHDVLKRYLPPDLADIYIRAYVFEATRPPPPDRTTEQVKAVLVLAAIVVAIVGLIVVLVVYRRRESVPDRRPPLSRNFGTASFAPPEAGPRSPVATALGVFLGKSSAPEWRDAPLDGPGAPVVTTPGHHTLIVARTRTGKGTRVIVPTLLRYAGSLFVIDPKGENAAITAQARRALGQAVHVLNPWGVMPDLFRTRSFAPATYNPLDLVDRNDANAVAVAKRMAAAISPVAGRGDDAFWEQNAANILAAVMLWLADQPGEKQTLARLREIVTLDRRTFRDEFLGKMIASTAYGGAIPELTRFLLDLADTTYTGIFANLARVTDFISDPQLKSATGASTFSMADLRDTPMTLYLVIPPDQIDTQKTWLRLLIAAATYSFRRKAGAAKTPLPAMMLIDEFPALGRLQDLPADIATMAGYGLDFTLVVQGIDQLKAIYDKQSGAILNNCAWKWYCNIADLEGAKHLSDSLGEATVRTFGKSFSSGSSGGGATEGESATFGEKGRRLLNPDEILTLGRDVAIVMQPEGPPMYVRPVDYWNLTAAFASLESDCAYLYWEPPLSYDENPYVASSKPGGSGARGEENAA